MCESEGVLGKDEFNTQMVIVLGLVFLCLVSSEAAPSGEFQVEHIEIPTGSVIIHESTLNLTLKTNQGTLRFSLTRVNDQVSDVPVFVAGEDGKLHEYRPSALQTELVLFQDDATGSTFVFQYREDNLVDMYARIYHDGKMYLVRPSSYAQGRAKRDLVSSNIHRMEFDQEYDASFANVAQSLNSEGANRQKRQAPNPQKRWIEVLVVTDYDIYDIHQKYLGTSDMNIIIRHIKLYFTLVVKEMDTLYQNAFNADPDLNIFIRLVGFVINVAPNVTWIDRPDVAPVGVTSSKKTADIDKALNFLNNWVVTNTMLPANDHVLGFTGRDLYRSSGAPQFGAAYRGQICSIGKSSLSMDFGKFFSVKTASRGIAINLNTYYDGDSADPRGFAISCASEDSYLMTNTNGYLPTYAKNSYRFSNCSKTAIKRFIFDGASLTTCLTNLANDYTEDARWRAYYPGQIYDATEQCKIAYGAGTGYCPIYFSTNLDFMCYSLPCRRTANSSGCYYDPGVGALTGTPCDDGKWCMGGSCVSSPSAPKGSCIAGDHGWPGAVANLQQTCAETFTQYQLQGNLSHNVLCNTSLFKQKCCQSCNVSGGNDPMLLTKLLHTCASAPCQNGACSETPSGSYHCTCPAGFTGINCEYKVACSAQPCLNGGTCVPQGSSYTCTCTSGYTGALCDQPCNCFPGDSVVTLRDGSSLPMSQLSIGNEILTKDQYTNEARFSPVLAFLDYKPRSHAEYLQITTANNTKISITPLHLILMTRDGVQKYVLSRDIKIGDALLVFRDGVSQHEDVQSITVLKKQGAFAPLTETGTVVVDNVSASCYAVISSHETAHWALSPLRWWSMAKKLFTLVPEASSSTGIHVYADWLFTLGKNYI